ncbi:MAG: hypothetical protein WDN04_15030 [Rhodospirillales bacterium]
MQPTLIDSVQDRDGRIVWRAAGPRRRRQRPPRSRPCWTTPRPQVADQASAFQVLKMMEGVVLNGTGVPVVHGLDRPIAGKTGTTQDYNDCLVRRLHARSRDGGVGSATTTRARLATSRPGAVGSRADLARFHGGGAQGYRAA